MKDDFPVYVYLVPKKKWPKKVCTTVALVFNNYSVTVDYDPKTFKPLGYEILNCCGLEVNGVVMIKP